MRIMNNLIVGLNGGVNRVTSARVVEGIGAYSNPFRPAPFSAKPCDCVEGTVKNHCVSHISKSATVPPVSVNTGSNLPKESAKSEVSLREEITETLGCERHHSPTFGTSSGCDVKQLPAFAKPGHTFRFITKTVIFSILIILIPVRADFGLPGWTAWICTVAFLAGLRQANRDYKRLISTSHTVQPNWSAGVFSPHGRSPFSPANMPASQTINTIMWSLGNEAPFSKGR